MQKVTYREAINQALSEEMKRDDKVVLIGEDIAEHGGAFMVTKDLLKKFGSDRVKNTPISESAIIGAAIGSSAVGLRPVAELMFDDFMFVAADQIVNQMAKLRYVTGGQIKLPLTVRCPMGGGLSQAAQHAQCVYGMFMNVPGLKIVCPSNPYDAKGILKAAIRDDNPVLYFEHIMLYEGKQEIPEDEYFVPLGKSSIKREGTDITIVAVSQMVSKSLAVAEEMAREGIELEIIDPITLAPLDMDPIIQSIKKTGKAIIAHNGPMTNGAGAEIAARICELAFEYIEYPILRVAEKDSPIPFSPVLEKSILPQKEDILLKVKEILSQKAI